MTLIHRPGTSLDKTWIYAFFTPSEEADIFTNQILLCLVLHVNYKKSIFIWKKTRFGHLLYQSEFNGCDSSLKVFFSLILKGATNETTTLHFTI